MSNKVQVPNIITIGGHPYKVEFDSELEIENNGGKVPYYRGKILINPFRPSDWIMTALIHEVLHIVDIVYCQNNLTEDSVLGLAEGLTQLFTELGIDFDWSNIPKSIGDIYTKGVAV